nr:DUF2199 domain-containing protein [Cellulosimicrobium cellulans]
MRDPRRALLRPCPDRDPGRGSRHGLRVGAWASLSADSFRRTVDDWDRPGREDAPPMFGWLSVELPGYAESTVNLKTMVHTRAVGLRPWLELERTDHPLAVEQRAGISWETYVERVSPRA